MYELAIVGGGPAGLTAAVYAARKKLNALLVSTDLGGQPLWTMGIENYMGYQLIEGPELMGKFEDQVKQFPLERKIGTAAKAVRPVAGGFAIEVEDGARHESKAVIIATGKRPRALGVPGEETLKGRGVTYCSICDGPVFASQRVAVVGGGNSALEAAIDMVRIAEHIDLVSLTQLTGDQILVDRLGEATNVTTFLEHEVVEISGADFVKSITIRDLKTKETKTLAVAGVFVEIGLRPNSHLVREIVKVNRAGEIEINSANETSLAGVFAAGDVTNVPEKQIVVAAGEGAKAALQAHRYLQRLRG